MQIVEISSVTLVSAPLINYSVFKRHPSGSLKFNAPVWVATRNNQNPSDETTGPLLDLKRTLNNTWPLYRHWAKYYEPLMSHNINPKGKIIRTLIGPNAWVHLARQITTRSAGYEQVSHTLSGGLSLQIPWETDRMSLFPRLKLIMLWYTYFINNYWNKQIRFMTK